MAWQLGDAVAICGVGQSPYGRDLQRSAIDLASDAIRNALDDCGLDRRDLDGMIVTFGGPIGADADTLAQVLGLNLAFYSQTWAHGRFTATAVQHAALAVASGMAKAVVCLASVSFSGRPRRPRPPRPVTAGPKRPKIGGSADAEGAREGGGGHGEDPVYGMTSPGAGAALVAQKYFSRYGATSEQLAEVAVALRAHAALNPNAIMRSPLTVEDHQASRLVCAPLHLLDYCLVNDGAAAVIVTTAERARDLAQPLVTLAAWQPLPAGPAEFIWAYPGLGVSQQDEARYDAGEHAIYSRAGVGRDDIDALFTYDAFSIVVWPALERWGFCGPGEAPAFVAAQGIGPGGALPLNTHGGLLSESHVMGWNHQVEIVRQLRGQAEDRQVPGARHIQWANVYGDSIIYRGHGHG